MKLVQLLAKELKEWPVKEGEYNKESDYCVQSDQTSQVFFCGLHGKIFLSERADETSGVIVTRSEWQAEREKMNKPKWIRHRGGKCPVKAGTKVVTRYRDGVVSDWCMTRNQDTDEECLSAIWSHSGGETGIMAYYIEETKDQEIEEVRKFSKDVDMNIGKGEIIHGPISIGDTVITAAHPKLDTNLGALTYKLEIDATEATQQIDSLVSKWGQIESPLKWRDAIIHCQAIIEDCEREIQRNVNLLDAEGLMMQKDSKKAMQHYQNDIDMSDWRNWQIGDRVCATKNFDDADIGDELIITRLDHADEEQPIGMSTGSSATYWPEMNWVKFVRRP